MMYPDKPPMPLRVRQRWPYHNLGVPLYDVLYWNDYIGEYIYRLTAMEVYLPMAIEKAMTSYYLQNGLVCPTK